MLEHWNKEVGCVGQSVQEVRVRPPLFGPPLIWKFSATPKFGVCHFCSFETVDFTTILYFFPAARAMQASQTVNNPLLI